LIVHPTLSIDRIQVPGGCLPACAWVSVRFQVPASSGGGSAAGRTRAATLVLIARRPSIAVARTLK
jgi:hypothetical protein